MRWLQRGRQRSFVAVLLAGLIFLTTRPAKAQDVGVAKLTPASPAIISFVETPIVLASQASISAKAVIASYVLFANFGTSALDLYKEFDVLDPIDLRFLVTLSLAAFLADEGFGMPDGAGFLGMNPSTGVAELVFVSLALVFLTSTPTLSVNRFPMTGIDTRQGMSARSDFLGNYAIIVFATALALVHFAYMNAGQHMSVPLTLGTPTDIIWTALGVYFLVRNLNGLYFVPKFGSPIFFPLLFTPLHAVLGPNGHFFISDFNSFVIHELTLALVEVALFPVKALAYGLTFLPTGELLFAYIPNIFAILDLATRVETDYTLTGNRQLLDWWLRPGYFPPRLLVDEFDNVSRKGLVVELTILGLLANAYCYPRPVLKHLPYRFVPSAAF